MNENAMRALRSRLAEIAIDLRTRKDQLTAAQLAAEQAAIDQAGGTKALGTNEEERKRRLAIAVAAHPATSDILTYLRRLEADRDRLEAELASETDERRAHEWSIRERLVDLLANTLSTHPEPRATHEQMALDDEMTDTSIGQACRITLPPAPATPQPKRLPVPTGRAARQLADGPQDDMPEPAEPRDDDYAADELAEADRKDWLAEQSARRRAGDPDDLPF